jgi:glycosyltransferase involved in cell wall biosynthesis
MAGILCSGLAGLLDCSGPAKPRRCYRGPEQKATVMDPAPTPSPRVSVCMAAYNGARHIGEQISSILPELQEHDELVIVNDYSIDNTSEIIRGFDDSRIRLIEAESNAGYVRTFERALSEARGQFVFLSDQDDIWIPGRVELMISALAESAMVVSNCEHVEGALGSFHELRLRSSDSPHTVRNILGIVIGYRLHWGCATAFRASMLDQILPFPTYMNESHDQWIAMVGNVNKSIAYLDDDTIRHRLHGENLTPLGIRSPGKILKARIAFLRNVATAISRARRTRTLEV